ncbi:putative ribonuclease H-like domain-containing protein [Tanacetum coccineum]
MAGNATTNKTIITSIGGQVGYRRPLIGAMDLIEPIPWANLLEKSDEGTQEHYVAGLSEKDKEPTQEYILLPLHPHRPKISVEDIVQAAQDKPSENFPKDNGVQDSEDVAEKEEQHIQAFKEEKKRAAQATSINKLNTGRPSVSTSNSPLVSTANTPYASAASTPTGAHTGGLSFVYLGGQIPIVASTLPNADLPIDPNMPDLEDDSNVFPNDGIFSRAYDDEDVGAEADFNNINNTIDVSPIPTLRVHKDHPKGQILGDPKSAVQTRGKIQKAALVQQALMISQALEDESWVEAMQEELLQFKLQKVWILVDLPFGKKVIGTKWVFRNKRDERSIVMKNKARLVAQGFRQKEESHHRFFPVDTSLILVESHKSPTKSLFDVGSSRISIFIVKNLRFTQMFWQYHKDNA